MTSITIYDGNQTIGGTKIYLEENDKGVFLDFGKNFAKEGQYFQEFLSSRSSRGIYDEIQFGLIPKLGIYRKDLIPSDLDVSGYKKLDVKAVLITHAHMDHFGSIGFLNPTIPIIGSPQTFSIIKAMEDNSNLHPSSEVVYYNKKRMVKDRVCCTDGKSEYALRELVTTRKLSETERSLFMTNLKSAKEKEGNYKELQGKKISELKEYQVPFDITPLCVDHSIYGATAYVLKGDTTVAYSGDFRMHGKLANNSRQFIQAAKDASILIVEGTRVSRDDELVNESEEQVRENCLRVTKEAKNLVVANFAGRNIERFEIFKEIAEKVGRKIIVPAKTAYFLKTLDIFDHEQRTNGILVYDQLKLKENKWEENFIKGNFDYMKPEKIAKAQDKYLLYFSFYEMKHLLDIQPNGGTFIYSSSEAFTEESEFDFIRYNNWLKHFNFNVHGFEIKEENGKKKSFFQDEFHASGHLSKEDIFNAITTIDPDIIIPVHTENPDWFKENFKGKVMLFKDGDKKDF